MSQTQGLEAAFEPPFAWRHALLGLGLALAACAHAQGDAAPAPEAPASVPGVAEASRPPVENSRLDGPLLYQLLLAEFASNRGQPADAIELLLEAARRTKDDALFRRALQVAAEAGEGDKALAISRAWRQTNPKSAEATRSQVQLLLALDRVPEAVEPLRQLLSMSPPAERAALITSLPRAAQRAQDKSAAAAQFQAVLRPYMDAPETRVAARCALARLRLADGDLEGAIELASAAQVQEPGAIGPALVALDAMNATGDAAALRPTPPAAAAASAPPAKPPRPPRSAADTAHLLATAEAVIQAYLAGPAVEPLVRQAYAGVLAAQQRLADAASQLRLATQARPDQAQLWLGLGELELELRRPAEADAALRKALDLVPAEDAAAGTLDDDSPAQPRAAARAAVSAARLQLLLARAAEQGHDDAAAARWLARIPAKDSDLQVIGLRATLIARQGKVAEARELVRQAPAATAAEQRARLLAEVQLLLDARLPGDARRLLSEANSRTPDDVDLIYQEAMIDERLELTSEMEAKLRRILELQPDNSQALNALGYSLADRNLRLDEALGLVRHAHELSPTDPFIVDSLGWVLFRMGRFGEAAALLNQAYASRRDTEIAAHLGDALWADGRHDEAAQVMREAASRDGGNETLKRTMVRLKVPPQ